MLSQKVKARTGDGKVGLKRSISQDSLRGHEPVLGLPAEPQQDLNELVGEMKKEMEARKRKSSLGKGGVGKGGVKFS